MSKVSDSSHVGDIGVSSVTIPLPQSSKYSDFSIECNGVAFPVHKIIVCTRSPVIGAAVDRGFKVMDNKRVRQNETFLTDKGFLSLSRSPWKVFSESTDSRPVP